MLKIITIVGARPQFVKAAVVSRAIRNRPGVEEIIIHTGQHFDANMSEVFFEEMDIPKPKYNLGIHGLGHGAMTGRMLTDIETILIEEQPDWLLVYGDTNSTLAGALAAKKLQIKVAHVEAGLRSFNMQMPEEINRILTDRISDLLFVPTTTATDNLNREGFANFDAQIVISGDVMQDAALYYARSYEERMSLSSELFSTDFILCTLHRQENTDDRERLLSIVNALNKIHETRRILMPLHPRTAKALQAFGIELKVDQIDPVGYFDMIALLSRCELVMTDSGGLQKEAYFFEKHCVTLRDETEWVELVNEGFNCISGAQTTDIIASVETMMNKTSQFDVKLYGEGNAGEKIVEGLLNYTQK